MGARVVIGMKVAGGGISLAVCAFAEQKLKGVGNLEAALSSWCLMFWSSMHLSTWNSVPADLWEFT